MASVAMFNFMFDFVSQINFDVEIYKYRLYFFNKHIKSI